MIALYSINLRILGLRANLPLLDAATIFDPAAARLAPLFGGAGGLAQRYAAILIFGLIVLLLAIGLNWFLHTELGLALRAALRENKSLNTIVYSYACSNRELIIQCACWSKAKFPR